jgi:hypothetical protein
MRRVMRIFDLEKIKSAYFSGNTNAKTEAIYSKSEIKIQKLEIDKITEVHNLYASISYDSKEYSIQIGFVKKGNHFILLGDRKCNCESYMKKFVNCEHMLALITYLNNYSYEELLSDDKDVDYTSKDILKNEKSKFYILCFCLFFFKFPDNQ